jgi:predicted transcriptional regulator
LSGGIRSTWNHGTVAAGSAARNHKQTRWMGSQIPDTPEGAANEQATEIRKHERAARALALQGEGWPQQAIADELGVTQTTVWRDLKGRGVVYDRSADKRSVRAAERRERAVALRRQLWTQPAIAEELGVGSNAVSVYLRQGLDEDERRAIDAKMLELRRTVARIEFVCEWCGSAFERTEAQIRAQRSPARFCSDACKFDWLHHGPDAEARQTAVTAALIRWRKEEAERYRAAGLMYLEELVAGLPTRLQRGPSAQYRHIALGLLVPTTHDRLGRPLYDKAAAQVYLERLSQHPDPRARRFNEDGPWVDAWHRSHHGDKPGAAKPGAVLGWFAPVIAAARGKKPGRPSELDRAAAARIRDMASRGKSQRAIALTVGVSRGQVERVLKSPDR